jgi:hypothetical protein
MSNAPFADRPSDDPGNGQSPATVRISRPPSWLEGTDRSDAGAQVEPDAGGDAIVIGLPRRHGKYIQGTLPLPWTADLPHHPSSSTRSSGSTQRRAGLLAQPGRSEQPASSARIAGSFAGPGLRLVEPPELPAERGDADQLFDPQRTPRSELPDPRQWAARLGQAIVEVLDGRRAASQLLRWTTPEIHRALASQARSLRGFGDSPPTSAGPGRVQVRSVHVCEPESGIAEASVVLAAPHRSRAMAIRLEGIDGRWRATVVMLA